eukprot:365825-Chlamydomonas_euryale.AAC.12
MDRKSRSHSRLFPTLFLRSSHARLLDLPSRLFYGTSLLPCADAAAVRTPQWQQLRRGVSGVGAAGDNGEDHGDS